jgi:hypothetical protein
LDSLLLDMLDIPAWYGEAPNPCETFSELDEVIATDIDQDLMGLGQFARYRPHSLNPRAGTHASIHHSQR